MAKAVQLIDNGIVGVQVRQEEGHGDAALVGVFQVLKSEVEVLVQFSDGIIEGQYHKLRDICQVKATWNIVKDYLLQKEIGVRERGDWPVFKVEKKVLITVWEVWRRRKKHLKRNTI